MRFAALIVPHILTLLALLISPVHSDPLDLTSLPAADRDLARRALALLAPEVLPLPDETAGTEDPGHALCGTFQALALRAEVSRASKRTQETLAFLFQRRPNRDFSMLSPGGGFLVHYDRDGSHGVDPTDANQNGHPDYVDAVADVFDDVWRYEVTQLGYQPPPSDGDGIYDIYIRDLSPTAQYGATYPQTLSPTSPSYIEIDNDFTDPVYVTPGLDGMRFTAAHEFFHAVQFGYYLSLEATWWYELTATWMQDEVFTDVNDHYSLVDGYLELPEAAMYEPPPISFRPYGAMVLAVHLTSVYGESTIRQTFEDLAARSPNPYTIPDSDSGLPGGFEGVLPRYWIWNYFTGSRARGDSYYAEASSYQAVNIWEITPIGGLTLGGFAQVQSLGATYARVNTANKAGGLHATFDLHPGQIGIWTFCLSGIRGSKWFVPGARR
jgi:hypothetical protein